jgi:uridine phosphorylase
MKSPEFVLNSDASMYHLNIVAEDLSDTVILVGDKDRVHLISKLFDHIDIRKEKREFHYICGTYRNKRMSVISTGIGTDNIDIVLNEIDLLVNYDFQKKKIKEKPGIINFVRIGTCGAIQDSLNAGTAVYSTGVIGFDNLLSFYKRKKNVHEELISSQIRQYLDFHKMDIPFYYSEVDSVYDTVFRKNYTGGISVCAPGFYGPQCRYTRLEPAYADMIDVLQGFNYLGMQIMNFEMESSALFALSRLMGHNAMTIDLVVANRITGEKLDNYEKAMTKLLADVLDRITSKE